MTVTLNIWYASDESLVGYHVADWRHEVDPTTEQTFIMHGQIPYFGESDYVQIFKPFGLFDNGSRCIALWNADDVNKNDLIDFIDHMEESSVDYHVGLIYTHSTDIPKELKEYEPEEYDYALVDAEDPTKWAKDYLQINSHAKMNKAAYSYLKLVALTDIAIVAQSVAHLSAKVADLEIDEDEPYYEITDEDVRDSLTATGQAQFFDLIKAIDSADMHKVVNLSMRFDNHSVIGVITNIRNRTYVATLRDQDFTLDEIMESFRSYVEEKKEYEEARQKLIKKNGGDEDIDESSIKTKPKYKISYNQAKFFYNNAPSYSQDELLKISTVIAKIDEDARSQNLNRNSLLQFATTVALINKVVSERKKSKKRY